MDVLVKLNIPKNSEIEFYEHFLIYKKAKILYSDIDGIAYLYTKTRYRINFIPVGISHNYVILIRDRGIVHKITFRGQSNQELFSKLANAIEILIKPFVLVNLLIDYIKNNKLEIKNLTISPDGLYRKRILRSPAFLPWDEYYNAGMHKGSVFIVRRNNKKIYKNYFNLSMASINAIVLPDLIKFLFSKNGKLDEVDRKNIINQKTQLTNSSAFSAAAKN